MPDIFSLHDILEHIPDEEAARLYFEQARWERTGKSCSHCGSCEVVECKDHKPMPYRCKSCRKHFSVRTGSVLEESRLPLQTWIKAIYIIASASTNIPSTQLAKELDITQKSAWFLAQRIHEAWGSASLTNAENPQRRTNA